MVFPEIVLQPKLGLDQHWSSEFGAEEKISTDRKVTTSKNQEDFLTCWETILLIVPFNNNMAHKPRETFGSQVSRISDKF